MPVPTPLSAEEIAKENNLRLQLADVILGLSYCNFETQQAERGLELYQRVYREFLDVLPFERLLKQRVVQQVNLPDRQVIGRPPVGVELAEVVRRERRLRAEGIARGRGCRAGCLRRQLRVHRLTP